MNDELATHISLLAVPIYAQMQPTLYDSEGTQQAKRAAAISLAIKLWLATRDTNPEQPT